MADEPGDFVQRARTSPVSLHGQTPEEEQSVGKDEEYSYGAVDDWWHYEYFLHRESYRVKEKNARGHLAHLSVPVLFCLKWVLGTVT